jgi:hypothetical protein
MKEPSQLADANIKGRWRAKDWRTISFWLKGVLDVSGAATSGSNGVKGLIKSKKRRPLIAAIVPLCGLPTF